MSALRRAFRPLGTATTAGFDRGGPASAGAGVRAAGLVPAPAGAGMGLGLAPALNEPAGFAVDLERVLAGIPRRAPVAEAGRPGPHLRRARGRWPRTPFHLPNAARIWVRDKGRRR
jgi:hypothetical protein